MAKEENGKIDVAATMGLLKPVLKLRFEDHVWPIYKMKWDDAFDAGLIEFQETFGDSFDLGNMTPIQRAALDRLLWVAMRRGAPGMTLERIRERDWNTSSEGFLNLLDFMAIDENTGKNVVVVMAVLEALGLTNTEEQVVNPLPASPSVGRRASKARSVKT